MRIDEKIYKKALKKAEPELKKVLKKGLMGLEKIIRDTLFDNIKKSEGDLIEKSLKELGGERLWKEKKPRVDIAIEENGYYHAVELKVVKLPNTKHTSPFQRFWDIGQLSSDYWSLKYAKKIKSAELGVLLVGEIPQIIKNETHLLRIFHDSMFIDYFVSLQKGCLSQEGIKKEKIKEQRIKQIKMIKEMGFDKPFERKQKNWKIIKYNDFAYISIPVIQKP